MGPIEFDCQNRGQLKIIGARLHEGHDFIVQSNTANNIFDYLLFFDSRGVSREFKNSLADKLVSKIELMGKTYLLVCRPLELTIWATLIGFLKLNQLRPAKIITNMGFVDFTPKKLSILQDVALQVNLIVGEDVASSYYVENFLLSGGGVAPLYSLRYKKDYQLSIETISTQYSLIIINTPLTNDEIVIQKKRPRAFFPAQSESNDFNRSITGAVVIDLPEFDERLTYDAVHYTPLGNEMIFDRVKDHL